jgi:hypothetical protein
MVLKLGHQQTIGTLHNYFELRLYFSTLWWLLNWI